MINYYAIDRIREYMKNYGVDGMYISNFVNISYILNQKVEEQLYITYDSVYLLTNNLYIEQRLQQFKDVKLINISRKDDIEILQSLLGNKVVGVESQYITIYYDNILKERYNVAKTVPIDELVELVRTIKSDDEVEKIKKACQITSQTFEYIVKYIKPYQTELQIKKEIEAYMFKKGATGLAFDTIVASGENTSKPHAVAGERKIHKNDIILFDFGASYEGYCSDLSRTIFIGKVDKDKIEKYNIVLEAQRNAIDSIQQYVNIQQVDNDVRKFLMQYDLNDKFIHSLGHGVGLDIHETPNINGKGEYILKNNMVLAIEPGIYFEQNYGIRIEDTILVKEDGVEILTNCKNKLINI